MAETLELMKQEKDADKHIRSPHWQRYCGKCRRFRCVDPQTRQCLQCRHVFCSECPPAAAGVCLYKCGMVYVGNGTGLTGFMVPTAPVNVAERRAAITVLVPDEFREAAVDIMAAGHHDSLLLLPPRTAALLLLLDARASLGHWFKNVLAHTFPRAFTPLLADGKP
jgi:hypothetical protein